MRDPIGTGEGAAAAQQVRHAVHARPACELCPDPLSYAAADTCDVHGHRQVTDTRRVALVAVSERARLAALDRALAEAHPDQASPLPDADDRPAARGPQERP